MERHGTAAVMPEIADAVFHDPGVDAVLFAMGAYSGGGADFDPGMVGNAHAGSGKPAVAWLYGPSSSLDEWRGGLEAIGIPCFPDLRGAIAALAGWDRMYRRGLEPDPPVAAADAERSRRLRAAADAARDRTDRRQERLGEKHRARRRKRSDGSPELAPESERPGNAHSKTDAPTDTTRAGTPEGARHVSLSEAEALDLLDAWGVSTVPREPARTPDEAVAAAGRLGYPVVLKAVSRDLAHKTEAGAVAAGLDSERAVRAAWRAISDSVAARVPQARRGGMMVQSMLQGREIIVGLTRVPGIGPVVMAGCGGVLVESRADVSFRLPPLDHAETDRMIAESGVSVALGAHRGGPAGDRCAVRDLLVRLAALAATGIGIHEVEINPLIVGDEVAGATAVDALVVMERR
ncbi:MAG: acetate--CoA ligase family protein [Thiotrichales bacterium]|nr:acetate--CoA ligase family protein [Thiotrichales bacterium]